MVVDAGDAKFIGGFRTVHTGVHHLRGGANFSVCPFDSRSCALIDGA